jgi:tetratricopeptide (TPR) repeat protein
MVGWLRKHSIFRWILASVLAIGLALAIWLVPEWFSSWQQRRLMTAAEAFFKSGDLRSAMISCEQLIQQNPHYTGAYRLLIAICEQANSPQAITWASKLADLSATDPEALVRLAALALKFGETEVAQETLDRLPAAAREAATVLSLQAAIDLGNGRLSVAESLFHRASQLEPSNFSHRLNLLKVQLQIRDKAETARQELEQLANDSTTRADALRAQLQDARVHGAEERALAIARQLASVPDAQLSDKLLLLDELRLSAKQEFSFTLSGLRQTTQNSENPGQIYQVMAWQNGHGLYQESLEWTELLPLRLRDRWPIPLAESEALLGLRQWVNVRSKISTADWGWMNYLRLVIYARAERELGSNQFQERWESALVATAGEWNAMLELADLAERWGWKEQAVQTLWIVARQSQGQRVALKRLYRIYSDQRNTHELYKVAKRILEIDPQDLVALNNVASLGLLLGEDKDQAAKLAEDVYEKAPSMAAFRTTYAFALIEAGQPQKALQILQSISVDASNDPSVGLYYGLTLAANGQNSAAEPYLETALQSDRLFPEEASLAQKALKKGFETE